MKKWDLLISSADAGLRYDGSTGEFKGPFASGSGLVKSTGIRFGPDISLFVSNVGPDNALRFHGTTVDFIDIVASNSGLAHPRQVAFLENQLFVSSLALRNRGNCGN
jgi:hypothetical protein